MVGATIGLGQTFADKYQIIDLIGVGGMANVWLARDERLGKLWAIKEIKPNTQGVQGEVFRQALIDEANLMKRLDHIAIPRVVDIMDTGKTIFVVMDYVEGRSLSAQLRARKKPFDQQHVISWGIQLCDVLGYLHTLGDGIVYRDMKPGNVIVREDQSVRLIDFGIALDLAHGDDSTTRVVGTPGYAAPEQIHPQGSGQSIEPIDGRADVYALGATLYTLVTGHIPKRLENGSGAEGIAFDMRPIRDWNPRLSEGLERIILRATQEDPADRYQSMQEMRYDLEHHELLTEEWRSSQKKKILKVRHRALCACASLILGMGCFAGSQALGRMNYQSVMHEAESASRVSLDGTASEAEQLAQKARALNPTSLDPYRLLLNIYKTDYHLSDDEARRLQKAFGQASGLGEEPGYAQLCFDVGICYLSYYGSQYRGGSVGNAAIVSANAAAPWFGRALTACEGRSDNEASLSPADKATAEIYRTITEFYDEVTRAGKEGRAAEEPYRRFWEALMTILEHEVSIPDAQKSAEGVRARLCQVGSEVLSSPTYLAGISRAGIGKVEAEHLLTLIRLCLSSLDAFSASDEFAEVFGPVFSEVQASLQLAERNIATVYGNPVAKELGEEVQA